MSILELQKRELKEIVSEVKGKVILTFIHPLKSAKKEKERRKNDINVGKM